MDDVLDANVLIKEANDILRRRPFYQLSEFEFLQLEAIFKQLYERFDILPAKKFREEMARRARLKVAH